MDAVFSDLDMTSMVLSGMADAYINPPREAVASTNNPEYQAAKLRQKLCEGVSALCMCRQTSTVMRNAANTALDSILQFVSRQFATMRQDALSWMASEPAVYKGINVEPTIPRSEAIRVFPRTNQGNLALIPMRVCFEVPLDTRGCGSMPIGYINAIPGGPTAMQFLSQLRTSGHWLRTWVHDLTWVDAPTHTVESLWLALSRGCAVCGRQCACQNNRIDLVNAEYRDKPLCHVQAMGQGQITPGQKKKSPHVGLNAWVEVPWDLKPVAERLLFNDVPSEPARYLARRILTYTHRSHMVSLTLTNGRRESGQSRFESYKAVFVGREGTFEAKDFDKTEAELVLSNVLASLYETTPDGSRICGRWVESLFRARLASIHESGLHCHMQTNGVDERKLREVMYPYEFEVTLPLLPMHGQPNSHCWMSALNLDEAQFCERGRMGRMMPPTTQTGPAFPNWHNADEWRKHALGHMYAFLSERLPRTSNSAFYRFGEIHMLNPSQDESLRKIEDLSSTYTSRVLNRVEHIHLVNPGGIDAFNLQQALLENEKLFSTWPHFHTLMREREGDWCADAEYEKMRLHFVRLDSVLGLAWRASSQRVHRFGLPEPEGNPVELQHNLLELVQRYLKATSHLAPAPLLMRHTSSIPPGPRHPDVLLRWFLYGIVARPCRASVLELELQNVFLLDPIAQDGDAGVPRDAVGVHVSLYTRTASRHLRISMGLSMVQLDAITRSFKLASAHPDRLGPKPLSAWSSRAKKTCKTLQRVAKISPAFDVDLLGRLLDCQWTPVVQLRQGQPLGWTPGFKALEELCCERCEWFGTVVPAISFCKWQGRSVCACSNACVF